MDKKLDMVPKSVILKNENHITYKKIYFNLFIGT